MRTIKKQSTGGFHLKMAHKKPPATPGQAESRWGSFGSQNRNTVKNYCLDDQFHLCCYSELRADEEGLGYHIEHVENKSQNPARTFDYRNLAACALDSHKGLPAIKAQGHAAQGPVVFGGHTSRKQQGVDMAQFVSCLRAHCRYYFAYLSDGRIVPAKAIKQNPKRLARAQYTIDLLNLNSPYLITLRKRWWEELDQLFQEHETKGWSLPDLASIDLVPTGQRLSRFFSLTRQFFGPVAEQTLKQYAPELR